MLLHLLFIAIYGILSGNFHSMKVFRKMIKFLRPALNSSGKIPLLFMIFLGVIEVPEHDKAITNLEFFFRN
jgi:fumarylacetoacetate (FAA) hydrolase family protein